ncbi:MAG: ceramidase domain-containing protein [Acidimicrobiia bacterium]|nr:ceramidase domain-containing protein [Acidimicrobiia bacterium]
MKAWTPTRIAVASVVAFALIYIAFGSNGWGSPAENEQPIGEISRWCERVEDGLLREPVNALGNLGFVVAGLAMLRVLARDRTAGEPNQFTGHTPLVLLYASATIFLGPGSAVMHGTHTFFGAWIDNVSMVAYILIPWLYNLSRLGRWTQPTLFRTYGALLAVYAAGYWFIAPDLGIGLEFFDISIGLWIISELLYRYWSPSMRIMSGFFGFVIAFVFGITPAEMLAAPGEYWWVVFFWLPGLLATNPPDTERRYVPWFWVGVGSFMTAYAIWLTGTNEHAWCRPDSIIQAHAIWHLLSAVATWGFFRFLRTEQPGVPVEASPAATPTNR